MITLNEFINYYSESANITKTQAKEEILRFSDMFKSAVIEKGGVSINGFIKGEIKKQKAKNGVNPHTKEKILIPEKRKIKVSAMPSFAKSLEED